LCRRAGTRGVRHPRLDSFTAIARLPQLRKQGAKLVGSAQHVLWALHLGIQSEPTGGEHAVAYELLSLMGFDPCGIDELGAHTGLTADSLSVMLLHLALDGRIASLPGGRYQQLPDA